MTTTDWPDEPVSQGVEVVENQAAGTVTFVSLPRNENPVPDTEWITVDAEDRLDPREWR